MLLTSLLGNTQKLDGGAMFGNVPKALWQRWMNPDPDNRIQLACRALLIQDGAKTILLETGIGACFNPELSERYGIEQSEHVLLNALAAAGIEQAAIDIVILSHLHFDHAGGLLSAWRSDAAQQLLFPNARYLVSKTAWQRACEPHARDRASFIPVLNDLLRQSNRLELIDGKHSALLNDQYEFMMTDGHTPGLLHTVIHSAKTNDKIIFASDLIPGTPWVHLPVSMGYDRYPELLIDEKKQMLNYALNNHAKLFYTHDAQVALSDVTEVKGKFSAANSVTMLNKMEF